MNLFLKNRLVDFSSLEVTDASCDLLDFTDAYYSAGAFMDGTPLTSDELEELYFFYPPGDEIIRKLGEC